MSTSQETRTPKFWSDLPTETLAMVSAILDNKGRQAAPSPLHPDDLAQHNFDEGRRSVAVEVRTELENRRKAGK